MITSLHRRVAFSILIAFLASLGSWELQARSLVHQVEHASGMAHPAAAAEHDHDHDHDAPPSNAPTQDGDHAVLHAVGVAAAAAVSESSQPALDQGGIVAAAFIAPAIEHATADPPFRPPRINPTLA